MLNTLRARPEVASLKRMFDGCEITVSAATPAQYHMFKSMEHALNATENLFNTRIRVKLKKSAPGPVKED